MKIPSLRAKRGNLQKNAIHHEIAAVISFLRNDKNQPVIAREQLDRGNLLDIGTKLEIAALRAQ